MDCATKTRFWIAGQHWEVSLAANKTVVLCGDQWLDCKDFIKYLGTIGKWGYGAGHWGALIDSVSVYTAHSDGGEKLVLDAILNQFKALSGFYND